MRTSKSVARVPGGGLVGLFWARRESLRGTPPRLFDALVKSRAARRLLWLFFRWSWPRGSPRDGIALPRRPIHFLAHLGHDLSVYFGARASHLFDLLPSA